MSRSTQSEEDPIWSQLRDSICGILGQTVEIQFSNTLNELHMQWYEELEHLSFRPQLRYTRAELTDRLQSTESLLMFILADGRPEVVLLGYALADVSRRTFYLDTIAVRRRGLGIGTEVIRALINWLRSAGYESIELDTEETDEKGIPLCSFYRRLGFQIVSTYEDGDIRMKLVLD